MSKILLAFCVVAMLAVATMAESSAVASLKAKVESGDAAAPCDKAPAPAGPAPPRQFLDIRLPHVVDDYHPPAGGFNPSHIPDKEVDVAARLILREIQAAEAEARANGDEPEKPDDNGVISTEEHKALKQLLLDSDILVRAAAKALAENGPIEAAAVRKVAASAVAKAASLEKKGNGPQPPNGPPPPPKGPKGPKPPKNSPIQKLKEKVAPPPPAPAAPAAAPAAAAAATPAPAATTVAKKTVGAAAPVSTQSKTSAASSSDKAAKRS